MGQLSYGSQDAQAAPVTNILHTGRVRKKSTADLRRCHFSPVSTAPMTMTYPSIYKAKIKRRSCALLLTGSLYPATGISTRRKENL